MFGVWGTLVFEPKQPSCSSSTTLWSRPNYFERKLSTESKALMVDLMDSSDPEDFFTDEGELDDEDDVQAPLLDDAEMLGGTRYQSSSTNVSDNNETCDELRGLVGLQNLGNTCYINAVLQALSNCQQLTRFVLQGGPALVKENGLSRCYRELIYELWSSNSSQYAVPSSMIRNIKCIFPAFRGCTQQDTQEFLRCFLEQLHDEWKQQPTATTSKKNSVRPNQQPQHDTSSAVSANSVSSTSTSSIPQEEDDKGGDETLATKDSATEPSSTPSTPPPNLVNQSSCDSQLQQQLPDIASQPSLDQNQQQSQRQQVAPPPQATPQAPIKQVVEEPRSIISDTFEFRISSSIVCSSCNNISTTKETFKDLSVPIPSRDHPYYQQSASEADNDEPATDDSSSSNSESSTYETSYPLTRWLLNWFSQLGSWFWGPQVTLYDCLSLFFGTDPLDGDNQYSCEVCTKRNRGVKYLKILELPEVLCIHFKRYESVGSAKITSHVTFPLVGLDLAPFMSPESQPGQCTTYNLIACICHHGSALLTGHYTTYALNCYDDQWYEFDDQYVTCVSGYQVENSEAYILFYQKAPQDNESDHGTIESESLIR